MHEIGDFIFRTIYVSQVDLDLLVVPKTAPQVLAEVSYPMDRRLLVVDEANPNLLHLVNHDTADRLALMHEVEALVDVLQL
ncbi:hypothetical protein, partial [Mesorhizobium sp.]|uniref:hypothetical protein n=1 Tax=Mesorhizobium sp. TaxID=1871066 RepID=UPI0025DB4683